MTPEVRLEMVNRQESLVALAAAVDGLVAALGVDALAADSVRTAALEAGKNVVLHAYEGTEGPMEVALRAGGETVEVTVTDHGIGIRPHLGERRYPHNGLGLPIIHQHARRVTYTNLAGGGTELRMEFPVELAGETDPVVFAAAAVSRLAGPLDDVPGVRAEVLIEEEGAAGGDPLLERLRERLDDATFTRLRSERRAPERGDGAVLVLLLGSCG
jgi:anti-sigma regulatory factor (Ser/Thr protein kinase)